MGGEQRKGRGYIEESSERGKGAEEKGKANKEQS